jgi:hypothetical protein
MTHTRDSRVVSRSDSIAFRLVKHCTELTNFKRFSFFSDAPLHEKCWPFRIDFDENGYN